MPGFKGRKPVGGAKAFGQLTRGKGPTPPKQREAAELPPLSPIERAHEVLEERRLAREWGSTDRRRRGF